MYGFGLWPAAPRVAGGTDHIQFAQNKSHNAVIGARHQSNRSSNRCRVSVSGAPFARLLAARHETHVSTAKHAGVATGAPAERACRGTTGDSSRSQEAEGLPARYSLRRGEGDSAANVGGYAKQHMLRSHTVPLCNIPALQGEQTRAKERTAADKAAGGNTRLVPLFKPEETEDGPACACLRALEPYTVLCCSAGTYVGDYFFMNREAQGEILGGVELLCPGVGVPADGAIQRAPQPQREAVCPGVLLCQTTTQPERPASRKSANGSLQNEESQRTAPDGMTAALHIVVAQQKEIFRQLAITKPQATEPAVQQGGEVCQAVTPRHVDLSEVRGATALREFQEPAAPNPKYVACQQLGTRQQERLLWAQCIAAKQRTTHDGSEHRHQGDKEEQREAPQLGADDFLNSVPCVVEIRGFQQARRGMGNQLHAERDFLMEERRRTPYAGEENVDAFALPDVATRIERSGLSALHVRIWEDPERRHLEDRLNIEDLSSAEGTWKKVRWDRPIPLCRGESSPRSSVSSASDSSRAASYHPSDDQDSNSGSEDEAWEFTERLEGRDRALGVFRAECGAKTGCGATREENETPAGVLGEEGTSDAHAGGSGKKWLVSSVGDSIWGARLMGKDRCPKSCHPPDNCPSSLPTATSVWQHTTPSRSDAAYKSVYQEPTLCTHSVSTKQQCHQYGTQEKSERMLQNVQPHQRPSEFAQDPIANEQQKVAHRMCEDLHVGRHPARRHMHCGELRCRQERDRQTKKQNAAQVVNFGGRLLRLERGPPLSPFEAFDEFLLAFEFQHLKNSLLACLRERGCRCARPLRTRKAALKAATSSSSVAQGSPSRGLGIGPRTGILQVAHHPPTAGEAAETATTHADASHTGSTPGPAGDMETGLSALLTRGLTNGGAHRKREIFYHCARAPVTRRLRKERGPSTNGASASSSRNCKSQNKCESKATHPGSFSSASSDSAAMREGMSARCGGCAEEASRRNHQSQVATEASINGSPRQARQSTREASREELSRACAGGTRGCFRSDVVAVSHGKPPGAHTHCTSCNVGESVAGGGAGEAAKRNCGMRSEVRQQESVVGLESVQSCWYCTDCEADPLRWLWRTGPLSLVEVGDGGLRVSAQESSDKQAAQTAGAGVGTDEMPATAGATRKRAQGEESPLRGKGAQRDCSLIFAVCGSKPLKSDPRLQAHPHRPHARSRLVLTPAEADRWRLACAELPRHFLPVSKKSRPLILYDEATGAKLGEVRWSGCFLVSLLQGHEGAERTENVPFSLPGGALSVAGPAAAPALAHAGPGLLTQLSSARDTHVPDQRQQDPLGKSLSEQRERLQEDRQQRQCGHLPWVPGVGDTGYLDLETVEEMASVLSEASAGFSIGNAAVCVAADLQSQKDLPPPSSQPGIASVALMVTPTANPAGERFFRGGEDCTRLDALVDSGARSGKNSRAGDDLNGNDSPRPVPCSTPSASTCTDIPPSQGAVVLKTQVAQNTVACALIDQRSPHTVPHTGPPYAESAVGDKLDRGRGAPRAEGLQNCAVRATGADPFQSCGCWQASSACTRKHGTPWRTARAPSPHKRNTGAGTAADDCKLKQKRPLVGASALPAGRTEGRVSPSRGATEAVGPHAGAATSAVASTGAARLRASAAVSAGLARAITSVAHLLHAESGQPSANPRAVPRMQTAAQAAAALKEGSSKQSEQTLGECILYGEGAPAAAPVQQVRGSSVSLLLQCGRDTSAAFDSRKTESRTLYSSTSAEASRSHEAVSSGAPKIGAHSTAAGDITNCAGNRPSRGVQTVETSQDASAPQGVRTGHQQDHSVFGGRQSPGSDGLQPTSVGGLVGDPRTQPLGVYIMPSSSPAAPGTAAVPARSEKQTRYASRRRSAGADGQWHLCGRRPGSSLRQKGGTAREERVVSVKPPSSRDRFPITGRWCRRPCNSVCMEPARDAPCLTGKGTASEKRRLVRTSWRTKSSEVSTSVKDYLARMPPDQLRTPPMSISSSKYMKRLNCSPQKLASAATCTATQCASGEKADYLQVARVGHDAATSLQAAYARQAQEVSSSHAGPPRTTSKHSVVAAVAAPLVAAVKSAAADVAAVAPEPPTAGALSGAPAASATAENVGPAGPSCAARAPPAGGVFSLGLTPGPPGAASPALSRASAAVESVKVTGDVSATPAAAPEATPPAASAGGASAPIPAAFRPDAPGRSHSGHARRAAGTLEERSFSNDLPASTAAGFLPNLPMHKDTAQSPAVTRFNELPGPFAVDPSHRVSGPATVRRFPLQARTPPAGASFAGDIRDSIRGEPSPFCRKDTSVGHSPFLRPLGAAGWPSMHSSPATISHSNRVPPSPSKPITDKVAPPQPQDSEKLSIRISGTARQVSSSPGADVEEAAPRSRGANAFAPAAPSTDSAPAAAVAISEPADLAGAAARGPGLRMLLSEPVNFEYFCSPEPLSRTVAPREDSAALAALQSSNLQLASHLYLRPAKRAFTMEQSLSRGEREAAVVRVCRKNDATTASEADTVGRCIGDTYHDLRPERDESQLGLTVGGLVQEATQTEALDENKGTSRFTPSSLVGGSTLNSRLVTSHAGTGPLQCPRQSGAAGYAEETDLNLQLTRIAGAFQLAARSSKDVQVVRNSREIELLWPGEANVHRSREKGVDPGPCGSGSRAPFADQLDNRSRASAAVTNCSGWSLCASETAGTQKRAGGHDWETPTFQVERGVASPGSLEGAPLSASLLPLAREPVYKKIHVCGANPEVAEAAEHLGQPGGGLSLILFTACSGKDTQDCCSTQFSVVHEARHRTPPGILSSERWKTSSRVDGSESTAVKTQARTSSRRNSSETHIGGSAAHIDESRTEDRDAGLRGAKEEGSNNLAHVALPALDYQPYIPEHDSPRAPGVLEDRCSCPTSPSSFVSDERKPFTQVRLQAEQENRQVQENFEEHSRRSTAGAPSHTTKGAAGGRLSLGALTGLERLQSPARKPQAVLYSLTAAAHTSTKEGEIIILPRAHGEAGVRACVRRSADTCFGYPQRRTKTWAADAVQLVSVSAKQNLLDADGNPREEKFTLLAQGAGRARGRADAYTIDDGTGGDSSTCIENADKRPVEPKTTKGRCFLPRVLTPAGRSGETAPARASPAATRDLKCMLFAWRKRAKTPSAVLLKGQQGQRADEDGAGQYQRREAFAPPAGSTTSMIVRRKKLGELGSAELTVQGRPTTGGSTFEQHRLKPSAISVAACSLEKDARGSWSDHPLARTSAVQKILSFILRPSTSSAHERGDGGGRTRQHDSVSNLRHRATHADRPSLTAASHAWPAIARDVASCNAERAAGAARVCRPEAAISRPYRSVATKGLLSGDADGGIQQRGPVTLCRELSDRPRYAHTGGLPLQHVPASTTTAVEDPIVTAVQVSSCAFSSQGDSKTGNGSDSVVLACGSAQTSPTCSAADKKAAGLKEDQQHKQAVDAHESNRRWVKQIDTGYTAALSAFQHAAAHYVPTGERTAVRLVGQQTPGTGEESPRFLNKCTPICGRRTPVSEEAPSNRKVGWLRLFPHKRHEGNEGCVRESPEVKHSTRLTRAGHISRSSLIWRRKDTRGGAEMVDCDKMRPTPEIAPQRLGTQDDNRERRGREEEAGSEGDHTEGDAAAESTGQGSKSHSRPVSRTGGTELALVVHSFQSCARGTPLAESTEDEGRASSRTAEPRAVDGNELRLLLQAQAYLLRRGPRREDFPEVFIPAVANVGQMLPAKECTRPPSPERTPPYSAKTDGQTYTRRTLKPCYAPSAPDEHPSGIAARAALSPHYPPLQHAPHQSLLYDKAAKGGKPLQWSSPLPRHSGSGGEDTLRFAEATARKTACNKRPRKVLCVYAAGEYQLLLADPDDDEEHAHASESAIVPGSTRAASTDHSSVSCDWPTCSCWVRLQAGQQYRLRPGDVLRVGLAHEFSLKRFPTGVASQQGYRVSMEDEEVAIQDLGVAEDVYCSFFAVYDGHGGRACAEFVKRDLHVTFRRELLRMCGGTLSASSTVRQHVYHALLKSFLTTDEAFIEEQQRNTGLLNTSGCTCVVVVILGGEMWCANCGDARAVLCRGGNALELSSDHKPDRGDELQRIVAAGGFVRCKRVLGRLAVSRAFGDVDYKGVRIPSTAAAARIADAPPLAKSSLNALSRESTSVPLAGARIDPAQPIADRSRPLVTALPEIRMQPLCEEDEFVLLACDGLFDVFSSQEAADFVREALHCKGPDSRDPQALVDRLLHEAIENRKSRDNVTAILVLLTPGSRSVAIAASGARRGDLKAKEVE